MGEVKVSNNRDFPRSNDGERCTKPASSLPIQLSPQESDIPFLQLLNIIAFLNKAQTGHQVYLCFGPKLAAIDSVMGKPFRCLQSKWWQACKYSVHMEARALA